MKYGLAALAVSAVLSCGVAQAADMPVKARPVVVPINTWDGYYVGINGGYSWGRWDSRTTGGQPIFPNGSPSATLPGTVSTVAGLAGLITFLDGAVTNSASPNVDGWVFGVHYGRNWQFDRWVLGLESDFDWTGEKARQDGTATFTFRTEFSHVRVVAHQSE